ncbi:hypothetical protein [Elizabethkingia sp. JS20170427COW]|uniref:hypothetical protein n=1 Tax=Elizabethkingia sp. JS20170427COW TaxID=2583851 RepID=UPI00143D766B|nr:hypothetical protein [Elizabethkingia sp. JS20170427COW]
MKRNKTLAVWQYPFLLALLTLIGLVWALVEEGWVDYLCSFLLLIPILVILKNYYKK